MPKEKVGDIPIHSIRLGKKRRFFFHYRKQDGRMSVHFDGLCIPCDSVVCHSSCESHARKTQPRMVMRGYASRLEVKDGCVIIGDY